MNKNQKRTAYYVFIASLLYFSYKTFNGIMNLDGYSGWRFYALLFGSIGFAGLALAGIYFHPRVKKSFLEDNAE